MNRYPLWKYIVIGVALLIAFLYTLPNFFGEVPAVQVSPIRTTVTVDTTLMQRVESSLAQAGLQPDDVMMDLRSVKAKKERFTWRSGPLQQVIAATYATCLT